MSELRQILDLWKSASTAREDVCLATVVAIEGSAYRRPGARMLLTSTGRRAGTISGGCLEAEVAKKAWWLTQQGPSLQRYSSFFDDDGDMPYGLGCGGTVIVLLERGEPAVHVLDALRRSVDERTVSVIVTSTSTNSPGTALIVNEAGEVLYARPPNSDLVPLAREALQTGKSSHTSEYFVEAIAPPPPSSSSALAMTRYPSRISPGPSAGTSPLPTTAPTSPARSAFRALTVSAPSMPPSPTSPPLTPPSS